MAESFTSDEPTETSGVQLGHLEPREEPQTLDSGMVLPPADLPKGLNANDAKEYAVNLAVVDGGTEAAKLLKKHRELVEAGSAITQREVVRTNKASKQGQELIAKTSAMFQGLGATVDQLNVFKEANKRIKEATFEEVVVTQYEGMDPATNAILNERKDAVAFDRKILTNELAFSNIYAEKQTKADGFLWDLADLLESLGPAQIEQMFRSTATRDLQAELQHDKENMEPAFFREKWDSRFEELEEQTFFDNPDVVIATYGILNSGSFDDAIWADIMRGGEALTSIGLGTGYNILKSGIRRAVLNKEVSRGAAVAPVKGPVKPGVQITTDETLRSKIPFNVKGTTTTTPTGPLSVDPLAPPLPFMKGGDIGKRTKVSEAVGATIVDRAITKGIKGERSQVSDAIIRSGGSKLIADDIVNSLTDAEAASILKDKEQVSYALMGLTPDETLHAVPMLVRKELEKQDRILGGVTDQAIDAVGNTLTGQALTKKLAIESADWTGGSVRNVSTSHNAAGLVDGLVAHVGAESGSPFATRGVAEAWMKTNKLKGEVFQSESGGYLVNIRREAGEVTEDAIIHANNSGWFKANLAQPSETIDANIQLLSRASEMSSTHIHNQLRDAWNNGIKPMSGKQRVELEEVMQAVQKRTKEEGGPTWLTPDEFINEFEQLHGKLPKAKHVLGYQTVRQLEDASYRILNRSLYKTKLSQGMGQVDYSGTSTHLPKSFAGKVVEAKSISKGDIILNASTGKLSQFDESVPIRMTKAELESSMNGHTLVKLDDHVSVGKDGMAQYALIPSNEVKLGELAPKQLGYIGGGRISYDYNWIVHASRSRTYSMLGGAKRSLSPVALFGGKTRKEVMEFASNLDKARLITKAAKDGKMALEEANTALLNLNMSKFQHVDEVEMFLKKRGVELDDAISANADGTLPGGKHLTEGEQLTLGIKNRVAKARSENRLEDIKGGSGMVSPLESLSSSLSVASRHASFADYRQHALTSFANAYGKHMDVPPRAGVSPLDVVQSNISDDALTHLTSSEIATINAHKDQILHTLRVKSPAAKRWSNTMDSLSDWFLQTPIKNKKVPFTGKTMPDILADKRSSSPVAFWKNIAFQSRMGMGSLPQFILQASMAPSIMAMSPKHGAGAMMDVIPLKMALQSNDPKRVKELAEKLSKARIWSRDEAADFVEFVETFKSLGISDFGASLPELAGATSKGVAGSGISNFLDKGQVFFRLGEFIPRATAAGIAARKIRAKGIKLSSDKGKAEMITEVNRLTLGITGADVQIGLRGAASVPTQFWSFPMRMISALTGKQLSNAEKAGMYGSFAVLWGAGGIPMGDAIINYYQRHWDTDLSEDEALLMYNGIVDTLIHHSTDGEIQSDLSSRMLGNFLPSVWETFAENPTMALIGGPTGGSIANGIDVFMRELRPVAAAGTWTLGQVSDAAIGALAANITSVDRLFRGWMAYQTGILRDRKGRANVQMSKTELALWFAGVPMKEVSDIYTSIDLLKTHVTDFSKELGLEMFQIHQRAMRDPSNEQIYLEQIAALQHIARNSGTIDLTLREYSKLLKDPIFQEAQERRWDKARLMDRNLPKIN